MADEYDPTEPVTFNAADDDDGDDGYDPADYSTYNQHQDTPGANDDDDDYDPSSVNDGADTATTAAQTSSDETLPAEPAPPAPKQPQKIAGFTVEDSDDDEDQNASAPPPPSQLNGSAGAESGLGAVAQAEAQDVSLRSAPQDTAAESTSLNGSTTVPVIASTTTSSVAPDSSLQPPAPANDQGKTASPVGSVQPTPQPQQNSIAPTPQPPVQNAAPAPYAPPARLPNDKVGQLNDRIKDDPKGDTDAWLALIQHYIDKEQYQEARQTYDRFFEVFPVAVCYPTFVSTWFLADAEDLFFLRVHILIAC